MTPSEYDNIVIAGDMFSPNRVKDKIYIKKRIRDSVGSCNTFIGNFEGVLYNKGVREKRRSILVMDDDSVDFFKIGNTNIMNLANNHISDMGEIGIIKTIETLKKKGFLILGAGHNLESSIKPVRLTIKGKKISFLSFASTEPYVGAIAATCTKPGVAPLDLDIVIDCIKKEKIKCDYLFLLLHWGREHIRFPDVIQIEYAKKFITEGADYLVGCHPHIIQGAMDINYGRVWFSLGNFLFPDYKLIDGSLYKWNKSHRNSLILNFKIINDNITVRESFQRIREDDGIVEKISSNQLLDVKNEFREISSIINNQTTYAKRFRFLYIKDIVRYYINRIFLLSICDIIKSIKWRYKNYAK